MTARLFSPPFAYEKQSLNHKMVLDNCKQKQAKDVKSNGEQFPDNFRLIKVGSVVFTFSCWKVIKAAIYIQWKKIISPTGSPLCLLADHITLLNPWAHKPLPWYIMAL